ncbi:gas vesicle protein GvpO [Streptomyces physcomitrii]|uniref:Gas vesicle protein n=1 Tax=Streptomyces physcomitrii TaxID=2724184 RepID=A0ABX1H2P3_9ACTN|nr:gas vesicle protein GvpO [Streptomyces physcomitrii]NKI42303.1 gas vesicle protein [Streptomyces physcomitrii]
MAQKSRTREESARPPARKRPGTAAPGPGEVAREAAAALEELISHSTEGVSAVRRTEEGWDVAVDVLEVARIPDTTSLLATYEVKAGPRGELLEYRRVRRYRRGAADE